MKKYFETLYRSPLFDGIEESESEALLRCLGAVVEQFDRKYTILAEGSPAGHIGIVLSGKAQISRVDYDGNRSIISEIGPSELFGEAFACAGVEELPVSVVASEPCEVMLIDCRRILFPCQKSCGFHQRLIFNLMRDLANKSIMTHQRMEITSKKTTSEKLMTYLSYQSKRAKSRVFEIGFDRQELADYLEVDRSGLSAEIGKLKRAGVIDCKKNRFELL